ncbi:hypothetical protein CA951_42225 [Rhodococcus sp. NCIMB 12038]|nr:hypothetical protein CA951_42225 [Rhodococcus sp. NCIMB 12038]
MDFCDGSGVLTMDVDLSVNQHDRTMSVRTEAFGQAIPVQRSPAFCGRTASAMPEIALAPAGPHHAEWHTARRISRE